VSDRRVMDYPKQALAALTEFFEARSASDAARRRLEEAVNEVNRLGIAPYDFDPGEKFYCSGDDEDGEPCRSVLRYGGHGLCRQCEDRKAAAERVARSQQHAEAEPGTKQDMPF
jgi:hypothetical protein